MGSARWHPEKALSHFEDCVQVLRLMGDVQLESLVLQNIAETLAQIGRHRESAERLEECLILDRRDAAQLREGDTLAVLGREYVHLARLDDAMRVLTHAIQLCIETGNRTGENLRAALSLGSQPTAAQVAGCSRRRASRRNRGCPRG